MSYAIIYVQFINTQNNYIYCLWIHTFFKWLGKIYNNCRTMVTTGQGDGEFGY